MIRNGDMGVNWCRSELSSTVASDIDYHHLKIITEDEQADVKNDEVIAAAAKTEPEATVVVEPIAKKRKKTKKRRNLDNSKRAENAYVNVFIEPEDTSKLDSLQQYIERKTTKFNQYNPAARQKVELARNANYLIATVPVSFLQELENMRNVAFVHPAEALKLSLPAASNADAPKKHRFNLSKDHKFGEDVLIGIIDVGGFDFAHPDFLDENGNTRFVRIWDQGGTLRPAPNNLGGSELTQKHMNEAIELEKKKNLPAHVLAPQSQQVRGSHGTHVASIAAGKSGVCRNAKIAAVTVNIPETEEQYERRRSTFSDSSQLVKAVEYLLNFAGDTPISINISLGTNGGGHDGSSGVTRWLDNALQKAGRSICVAAGNSGQEKAQREGDLGWIMGRIHSSGRIASRGLDTELGWVVVGDGTADLSENELEIWYSAQDRFIVEVLPPGESKPLRVEPQDYIENKPLKDGTLVSIYNELYHPANGFNAISVYLSPHLQPDDLRGVRAGTWKIRLIGEEIRNGEFHCWIERDDPSEIGRTQTSRLMRFPSYFTESSNVDSHSISSLACGHATVAVSNYDTITNKMNITSAQGPTRDNRFKPDIAAPGTNIVAANGFREKGDSKWVKMSGTSMASPYVAGVIGLMLAVNKDLTARQCMGILQRTSTPLPGQSYEWTNDSGFGRINANEAIKEAKDFTSRNGGKS